MSGVKVAALPLPRRGAIAAVLVTLVAAGLLLGAGQASAAGSISGKVTAAATEAPIAEAEVCAYTEVEIEEWEWVSCEKTDPEGDYTLAELAAGEYLIEFWSWPLYLWQFWEGKSRWGEADVLAVADETLTGIDAALIQGGTIEGTVTDAGTGAGIQESEVCAYEEEESGEWGWFECAYTDAAGHYAIPGLPPGKYVVEFWAPGYVIQFFAGKADPEAADRVQVSAEQTIPGVDAAMRKPSLVPPGLAPPPPPPGQPIRHKRKKCRKGFRRKKVRGHVRCVKVKKHRRRGRGNRR